MQGKLDSSLPGRVPSDARASPPSDDSDYHPESSFYSAMYQVTTDGTDLSSQSGSDVVNAQQ
eukprot:252879-Hanusia_phi.AAC.1